MDKEEVLNKIEVAPIEEAPVKLTGKPVIFDINEKVEKLMLNTNMNKYDAILLIRRWIYELKAKDQNGRPFPEIMAEAIDDILTEKVKKKTVRDLPPLTVVRKAKTNSTSSNGEGKGA